MIKNSIKQLEYLVATIPILLQDISEEDFSFKQSENKWSKKEILGHLIDSAANNHHRFIRSQFEETPMIAYYQNDWVKFSFYQQIKSRQLIDFWRAYNLQLIQLFQLIPTESINRKCNTGKEIHSLDFLINDYVEHLEHHLKQIVKISQ